MAVVNQTNLPKSVCNRIVVKSKILVVIYVVTYLFEFSVDVRTFVLGLSQISSFFSLEHIILMTID